MKDRIGTWRPLVWPLFDVNGAAYNRPATTVGIDDNHFVVSLKGEITAEQRAAIEAELGVGGKNEPEAPVETKKSSRKQSESEG